MDLIHFLLFCGSLLYGAAAIITAFQVGFEIYPGVGDEDVYGRRQVMINRIELPILCIFFGAISGIFWPAVAYRKHLREKDKHARLASR